MSQVSFWSKPTEIRLRNLSLSKFTTNIYPYLRQKQMRKLVLGMVVGIAIATMLLWNWRLLIATSAGMGVMLLMYSLQISKWQHYWQQYRHLWQGSNQRFSLAVGTGGLAAVTTYLVTSIWIDSENRWLATGMIIEGGATFATLILLVWHIFSHRQHQDSDQFNQLVRELTDIQPLKRLIAVRQLNSLLTQSRLNSQEKHLLRDYFRIMLSQESEPSVRAALLESLGIYELNEPRIRGRISN